jgi:D-3-phosphoglycerate dehydrogenase
MSKLRVFITHSPSALANYYGERALQAMQAIAQVRTNPSHEPWTPNSLAEAAQGSEIIVSDRRAEGSAELFEMLPGLLAFCRCAVDIRNVNVQIASQQGVLVTQASAGFINSVAEWTIGVMIDLSRGISTSFTQYHSGVFAQPFMGRELHHSTLGIIGYGQIGRALADLALAFGMQVIVSDPFVRADNPALKQMTMDELLRQSDYVVCLATATPQTENLMNAAAFAKMQPSAFFINPSRGDLVDEAALLLALDSGHIAGCALDVGREPDQMPGTLLARHPRVIATPHIGGLTPQAIEHQSMETVQQVSDLLNRRQPQGAVNWAHSSRLHAWLARA